MFVAAVLTEKSIKVMSSRKRWTLVYVPVGAPWSRMEFTSERGAEMQKESLTRSFPGMRDALRILPPRGLN